MTYTAFALDAFKRGADRDNAALRAIAYAGPAGPSRVLLPLPPRRERVRRVPIAASRDGAR
jgi:hypothetical protein